MNIRLTAVLISLATLGLTASVSKASTLGSERKIAGIMHGLVSSTSIDLRGIEFKTSRPEIGGNLMESAKTPASVTIKLLQQDLEILKMISPMRAKVVGYTDDRECAGAACDALSLRRAQCVYDWFVQNGVSKLMLDGPEGHGSSMPIDDNETEAGRQRNRRAEVNLE